MIRHIFMKIGSFLPKGKFREIIKSAYNGILHLLNEDNIIFTTDPELFIKKLQKMQKQTAYNKFWAETEKWNCSEEFPEHYPIMIEWFEHKLVPLLNKEMEIVDMPCANGELSFYFSKYVKSIDGFDISEKMIKLAKQNADENGIGNINFEQADAQTIVFNKKYDVFMMFWLLPFIYDDNNARAIIKKIYDTLPKGGYIVIKESLWENTEKDMYYLDIPAYFYAVYRTAENFFALIEKHNFSLIDKITLERKKNGWYAICAIFRKQ